MKSYLLPPHLLKENLKQTNKQANPPTPRRKKHHQQPKITKQANPKLKQKEWGDTDATQLKDTRFSCHCSGKLASQNAALHAAIALHLMASGLEGISS